MALKNQVVILILLSIQLVISKKNILFLVADDMRPQLASYYGPDFPSPVHPKMYTPNLDKLASKSLLLKRAYCQQAICSPSRTSLLTGRRPDTTHVYDLKTYFRKSGGNFTTIPQFFKENGYLSVGMGKIFHPGKKASGRDDPISWSVPYFHGNNSWRSREKSWWAVPKEEIRKRGPLRDQQVLTYALKTLDKISQKARTGEQPFFMAVGFHKPHLPFIFPEEFLNYYPPNSIRLPANPYAPVNMPAIAWSDFGELRKYADIAKYNSTGAINSTFPKDVVLDLRRAYYSALTFTDSLIGQVIAKLDTLGLRNNTIISFWGDHGWQLGENGEWTKHTNFEQSTHAPMMVSIPGVTDKGIVTEHLTEFVDLFPTLVEATGFKKLKRCPKKSVSVELCTEGSSLIPLINNPKRSDWKKAVFSQYPRKDHGGVMGYTMRTDKYRYTEWVRFKGKPEYKPKWDKLIGAELYDHEIDAEENVNRANDYKYKDIRASLSDMLHKGWRQALQLDKVSSFSKSLLRVASILWLLCNITILAF